VLENEISFVGYRKLRGIPLSTTQFNNLHKLQKVEIFKNLAQFIRELHAFPISKARAVGVSEELFFGGFDPQQRLLLEKIAPYLSSEENIQLERLFSTHKANRKDIANRPYLLHSDLKARAYNG